VTHVKFMLQFGSNPLHSDSEDKAFAKLNMRKE